ncbi:MAG TPA: CHAT domain-containing protein, partial [Ktedonobacteraceae bacterium]|nr:CHAT domain-containing protein [Ktedonobacteraceae bacterium]
MEQLSTLHILRNDAVYRFRLESPNGQASVPPEITTELTAEQQERLRRLLLAASQYIQSGDIKGQVRRSGSHDAFISLGRFLFDTLLPPFIQESVRHLDAPLLLNTNTPDIPWELLYDSKPAPGHFICQHMSIGRQSSNSRSQSLRALPTERLSIDTGVHKSRKPGRRETQGLTSLFLVNPTGECPAAEEEVATLCTTLPESIARIILYRQQANQLEMRMHCNTDMPQVIHYAGPVPTATPTSEPLLALAGNSRLDNNAAVQLLQSLPKRPLIILSYYDGARVGTLPPYDMEALAASNLMASGANAVLAMRWAVNAQRAREFTVLFYQEVAEGVSLGEALRRARATMVQRHPDDLSWLSYILYGDPTTVLVVNPPGGRDRNLELPLDALEENMMQPMFSSSNALDRRFLQEVLSLGLMEARRMHKDYLGTPHLFIALTKLDGGCTQDALRTLNFSPKQVRDVVRLALGPGKATSETPILPTRRCKEILQTAERNALNAGSTSIDERAIAQAVLSEKDGVTHELLTKMGINPSQLIEMILSSNARALLELVPSVSANPAVAPIELPVGISPEGGIKGNNSTLERLGRDLT